MRKVSRPQRGEVWRADLDPVRGHEQAGTRPILIISDNIFNNSPAQLVIALPITSKDKNVRSQIVVNPPEGGLTMQSFIKCDDIRSLSLERLHNCIGEIEDNTLLDVEYRLRALLKL